jgi:hypothetical protein
MVCTDAAPEEYTTGALVEARAVQAEEKTVIEEATAAKEEDRTSSSW